MLVLKQTNLLARYLQSNFVYIHTKQITLFWSYLYSEALCSSIASSSSNLPFRCYMLVQGILRSKLSLRCAGPEAFSSFL